MRELDQVGAVPVALSADAPHGEAHPVIVEGAEVALWRDEAGDVHLWEDRCPHRGMRLSFGFVRGDRLTCLYHGWEFGAGGACKRIPAHPDLEPPETLCADRFAVAERYGMVVLNGEAGDEPEKWRAVRSIFLSQPKMSVTPPDLSDTPWRPEGPFLLGTNGAHRLALAIQAVNSTETALHLTTTVADPSVRLTLARALVAYRTQLMERAA